MKLSSGAKGMNGVGKESKESMLGYRCDMFKNIIYLHEMAEPSTIKFRDLKR